MEIDPRFLSSRPRRVLEWNEDPDGRAVLLRPKFGKGRLAQWIASFFKSPYYQIHLDDVGTLIWKLCDGDTPLSRVVERMRKEFGDRIEPAELRLHQFISQMTRSRLIQF
ncbi:MAG: PqqD family protein [Acidobacteriota bacterium]